VGVQALQQTIQEWASPDFHELYQQPYLWLLVALMTAFGLSGRKIDGTDLITVIFIGAFGLIARRNFGPFALAAAPVLSRYLWQIVQDRQHPDSLETDRWGPGKEIPERFHRRPRWQIGLNLALVGIFFATGLIKLWVVTSPFIVEPFISSGYPVGAARILQAQKENGRILNEYHWGGYLDWTLPEQKFFIDGRTDLFGDELIFEWMQLMQASGNWKTRLDDWQIDWVLVEPGRPINQQLGSDTGWQPLYSDEVCQLWRRVTPLVRQAKEGQ
jgi:hypothetical protein